MQENKSLDPEEIERFNSLVKQWSEKNSPFSCLKASHDLKCRFILEKAGAISIKGQKLRLLDVGCGNGDMAVKLDIAGFDVTAIEPAPEIHKVASSRGPNTVKWHLSDIESFQSPPFHIITAMDVIEHLTDYKNFLKECFRLLHDDGILIISTINRTTPAYFFAKLAAEYLLGLAPKGCHDWNRFIKPSELSQQVKILDIQGLGYNIFTGKWHKTDNIGICYIAAFKKPTR